ncbi:serine protease [Pseudorhodoferax sp. Leaf267]|uniref:S1 family peptidase n=1 Tax=Pseudorhodoferax sp. Leaf267 TaxID=1736316 RepID=UPI00138F9AF3|nr:serine protease [Pseudorhodoferax sp. Leaf267]
MAEPSPQGASPAPARRPWGWLAAAIALVLLLAAAWWWFQGRTPPVDARQAELAAALERGKTLTAELAAIKPVDPQECPPGEIRQPIAGTPAAPASAGAPAPPASALPATGSMRPLSDGALAEHLEKATALVLVPDGNNLGMGTGFFITPNLLVTNRHVVEAKSSVLLASSALKTVRRATVLRTTTGSDIGTPDFALVRMEEGTAPGTLDTAENITKLAGVVAAGFPSVVVQNDQRFRRLLAGDAAAAPDLSLTQGAVQSLQSGAGGMPLIVHTASIAKGNSGGPLVDACGRLVGVNTFINVDQSQSARIQYAIRAQAMHAFLQSSGANARNDPRDCSRG